MKSVANARKRILQYPEALAKCAAQAAVYGKCVASKENLGKSNCMKEFEALQECVKHSSRRNIAIPMELLKCCISFAAEANKITQLELLISAVYNSR